MSTIRLSKGISDVGGGGADSQARRAIERMEGDSRRGDRVRSPLLAVDHANCSGNVKVGSSQGGHRREQRAPRSDHVLDHANPLAGLENALKTFRSAVLLCLFPYN